MLYFIPKLITVDSPRYLAFHSIRIDEAAHVRANNRRSRSRTNSRNEPFLSFCNYFLAPPTLDLSMYHSRFLRCGDQ